MRVAIVGSILALAAGCGAKGIEIDLVIDDNTSGLDVSCVDTVQLIADSDEDFYNDDCIVVDSPSSVLDVENQVRGQFEIDIPDHFFGVTLRALTGGSVDQCGRGTSVFYAGADYTPGSDTVAMRAEGSLDCQTIQTTAEYNIRTIDFLDWIDSPPGADPVCTTPPGMVDLWVGTIHPTNYTNVPWTSTIDAGVQLTVADGAASIPAWGDTENTSCLAVSSFEPQLSASCVYPASPTICGNPGDITVPMIRVEAALDSIDGDLFDQYPSVVFGIVWDSTTKQPVEGATIDIDPSRGTIVYANRGAGNRFEPVQAQATTASGLFLAYMREPSVIHASQGGSTKALRLAADSYLGSAVIVPLR
jgi:hypothetical protein